MSQYSPKPHSSFGGNGDIGIITTGSDTTSFALKVNLINLRSVFDKLDLATLRKLFLQI